MQNLNTMDLVRDKKDLFRVQIRRQKNDDFFSCKRQRSSLPFLAQKNEKDLEKLMKDFQENLKFSQLEKCAYHLSLIRRSMIISTIKDQEFENMSYFVQNKLIENLLQIISAENFFEYEKLIEEATWCLSNLAGGNREHIKEILNLDCINYMKKLFQNVQNQVILDNVRIITFFFKKIIDKIFFKKKIDDAYLVFIFLWKYYRGNIEFKGMLFGRRFFKKNAFPNRIK
jgi:hypothetical protein